MGRQGNPGSSVDIGMLSVADSPGKTRQSVLKPPPFLKYHMNKNLSRLKTLIPENKKYLNLGLAKKPGSQTNHYHIKKANYGQIRK